MINTNFRRNLRYSTGLQPQGSRGELQMNTLRTLERTSTGRVRGVRGDDGNLLELFLAGLAAGIFWTGTGSHTTRALQSLPTIWTRAQYTRSRQRLSGIFVQIAVGVGAAQGNATQKALSKC